MSKRPPPNQNPEQLARDAIDRQLCDCGWVVQEKSRIDWQSSSGIAVKHYPTQDSQVQNYVLFVDRMPVGIIEAKKENEGHRLTVVEEQSEAYAQGTYRIEHAYGARRSRSYSV